MTLRLFATLLMSAALAAPALAQTTTPRAPAAPRAPQAPAAPQVPPPPEAPKAPDAPPPPPAPPRRAGQPVNIKVDVTITDQGDATMKKTVSVVTADGLNGRIRSVANYAGLPNFPLNIDVEPELIADGKIRVRVNLEYSLPGEGTTSPKEGSLRNGTLVVRGIQENLSVIVESGKSIVAAQSADPVGDRQVTIELKATVLR